MGEKHIQWGDCPEFGPRKYVKVLSPKPGKPVELLICNAAIVGVWTHYLSVGSDATRARTQPCTGHKVLCPGCLAKRSRRWKGYLGCWAPRINEYCIGEVTFDAARSCQQLVDKTRSLRGYRVTLQRMSKSPNGPVCARLAEPRSTDYLPDEFDVRAVLTHMWGWETQAWGGDERASGPGAFGTAG